LAAREQGSDSQVMEKTREMESSNIDIHFHVWDFDSFDGFVNYSRENIAPWSIVWKSPCVEADPTAIEFYFVLTK